MTENPLRDLHKVESGTANCELDLSRAIDTIVASVTETAQLAATAAGQPFAPIYKQLVAALFIRLRGAAPTAVDMDARTAKWRVRIRLYDQRMPDEPQIDSDPDLPPGHDGTEICCGLPAVAEWLIKAATEYHKEQLGGLDMVTLRHRLKSLRPTLSRRGGNAVWRVPYTASTGEWLARCDVVRVPD